MKKILTISIAAYNVEMFIEECLESLVISSILDELEVIVINDGSTDKTSDKIQQYCNLYPKTFILVNKKNGGWGSTINESIKIATGKYFKLLDSDDFFNTINLAAFIKYLKSISVDLVLTPYSMYDDITKEVYEIIDYNKYFKNEGIYNYMQVATKCELAMHAMTVKTEIIRKSGIVLLEKCFYTDVQYVLELSCFIQTMAYKALSIYCYRFGREEQSCSMEGFKRHHLEHQKVIKYMVFYFDSHNIPEKIKEAGKIKIKNMIYTQYNIYMNFDKKNRKHMLQKWDKKVRKEYSEYYFIKDKRIKLYRIFNFNCIDLIDLIFKIYIKTKRFLIIPYK